MNNDSIELKYINNGDILGDSCAIIDKYKAAAYRTINLFLIERNWLLGKRIAEEELNGKNRADYGLAVITKLSKELTNIYGKGFTKTNLYSFYQFYKLFPEIFHSSSGKSKPLLSWTHYRVLIQVHDKSAREWYETEAYSQNWSVRTLQRNVETQYYYRLLSSQNKVVVEKEMNNRTSKFQSDKLEYVKNPFVAEFLGLATSIDLTETELESAILSNIQKFIMELGKGYAFVARQQRISTEKREYYIDLVFYNYILKCFV